MENTTLEQPIMIVSEDKEDELQPAVSVSETGHKAGQVILILGILKLVGDFVVIILKFFQL